jgi:hypothetical protein
MIVLNIQYQYSSIVLCEKADLVRPLFTIDDSRFTFNVSAGSGPNDPVKSEFSGPTPMHRCPPPTLPRSRDVSYLKLNSCRI